MKYLITLSLLLLASLLSAQDFRLLADGGGLFPSEGHNRIGSSGHFGMEMLVPVAPATYLTVEGGLSHRSHRLVPPIFDPFTEPGGGFVLGDLAVRFTEGESYRVRSVSVVSGVGIEQHVNRFRAQLSGRVAYRVSEKIQFREETVFSRNRPMNVFEAEVASGERYQQGVQTGQVDLNTDWRFQLGTSVRYSLSKRLEVGLATYYDLGNYRVERRTVSFCENCPVDVRVAPERSIKNRGIELLLSTRYVL